MKFKINRSLVPVKVHFFFFFAALGPLLPQINVFGRQLGVSPGVMGMVTAVLPLLWAAAKPLFGYVVDYWPTHRKLVFMMLIGVMSGSYCCLWFLPMPDDTLTEKEPVQEFIYNLNDTIHLRKLNSSNAKQLDKYNCHWTCSANDRFDVYPSNASDIDTTTAYDRFDIYLSNSSVINTVYLDSETVSNGSCSLLRMDFAGEREGHTLCKTLELCNLICVDDSLPVDVKKEYEYENATLKRTKRNIEHSTNNHVQIDLSKGGLTVKDIRAKVVSKVSSASTVEPTSDKVSFYMTGVFWAFVVFTCLGTVAFNVANCIGDAVCFDVLGPERGSKYGAQRAWGTVGYGVTALLGGWLIDTVSGERKDFTPAFIVAIVATVVDLFACRSLNLPSLTSPDDSGKALREVLKIPRVIVFIIFAVVAGTFDSFIIYYMFWFLEELAEETGQMGRIKLIEGVVVAGQSFIGELVFFYYSGKILKRFGYGTTMTFCLFCYGVRLLLISFIQHPWHLVFIESLMQGPTYALCYATIVGYAARVAPEGYSATVQGIVAGMDDGVGFALGSLVGGQLYSCLGGRQSFRALAATAVLASVSHAAFFVFVFKKRTKDDKSQPTKEEEKMLPIIDNPNQIYKQTVEPISSV